MFTGFIFRHVLVGTALLSAGVYEVLYFPNFVDTHQLVAVSATVAEGAFVVKIVRSPCNCQVTINTNKVESYSFVCITLLYGGKKRCEAGNGLGLDCYLPVFVDHRLQDGAIGKAGYECAAIGTFHGSKQVVDGKLYGVFG